MSAQTKPDPATSAADALYAQIMATDAPDDTRDGDARANYVAGFRAGLEQAVDRAVPVVGNLERAAAELARHDAAMRAISRYRIEVRYVEQDGSTLWAAKRRVEHGWRHTVAIFPTAADAVLWMLPDEELAELGLDVAAEHARRRAR